MSNLPDWLLWGAWYVLLGEIYPPLRAVALKFSPASKTVTVRYYVDREPLKYDHSSAHNFIQALASLLPNHFFYAEVECEYADLSLEKLDPLDGFVYMREEFKLKIVK